MLRIEVIEQSKSATYSMSLNPNSIISMRPRENDPQSKLCIRELNGMNVESQELTEITYSLGTQTKTILAIGSYSEIMSRLNHTRRLLNG